MAFFYQKTCVYEKIAVLLQPISRSRAVVARQAHNLEVAVFKSCLRNQSHITVSIQIGTVFLFIIVK